MQTIAASSKKAVEHIFNIVKVAPGHRSEDTFSSDISSDLSDSEIESIENDIRKLYENENKAFTNFDTQLFKEFQARLGQTGNDRNSAMLNFEPIVNEKVSEIEKLNDPVYLRHHKKQTIMKNAKQYIENKINEMTEQMGDDSADSFSDDSSEDSDKVSASENNKNLTLYHKSNKITLPKSLIDFGIESIFDSQSIEVLKNKLTNEDFARLSKTLPKGVNIDLALDQISQLADEHAKGYSLKEDQNRIDKNPFL